MIDDNVEKEGEAECIANSTNPYSLGQDRNNRLMSVFAILFYSKFDCCFVCRTQPPLGLVAPHLRYYVMKMMAFLINHLEKVSLNVCCLQSCLIWFRMDESQQ